MLLTAGYIASKSDCKPPIRASGTDWLQRWGQRSSLLVIVRSAQYALPMQTLDNHASWCRGPLSIDFGWVIYKQRSVWVLNYEHQFHFRNSAISHIANETARFGSIIRQLYKKNKQKTLIHKSQIKIRWNFMSNAYTNFQWATKLRASLRAIANSWLLCQFLINAAGV